MKRKTVLSLISGGLLLAFFACDSGDSGLGDVDGGPGDGNGSDSGTDNKDAGGDGGDGTDAGQDDGGNPTGNLCELREQAIDEAVSEVCAGRDDECCYCKCYNQGKLYSFVDSNCECRDAEVVMDAGADGGGKEDECVGDALAEAEDCLADVESCVSSFANKAEAGCQMSLL